MDADFPRKTVRTKEVTRLKRFSIIAAVIVVVALVIVPAAFAGYRPVAMDGYTPVNTCTGCHGATVPPASNWAQTAHASVANNAIQNRINPPRPTCAGCHSGNFDPAQPMAWDDDPASPTYGLGANATEVFVSCSSCHYSGVTTHKGSAIWNPGNPAFSPIDYGQFANPDICGQCHDQRSQAKEPYPVYNPADPTNPTMTILRFWPPYNPYDGTPRTDVMDIGNQLPLWTGGYAKNVHDTGAVQYDELLLTGGHFESWANLNAFVPDSAVSANEKINFCAHCMSTDQRILVAAGKLNVHPESPQTPPTDSEGNTVTKDQIKYGVTCVACHDPHKRGVSNSAWDGEFEGSGAERNAQLRMPRKDLCGSCHNGELQMFDPGATSFAPGAEINHPTQEFMSGIGAIDVPQMPALHKGLCVQCHMAPTATNSTVTANHVFTPIMPETAMHNTLTGGTGIASATSTPPGASEVGNTVTISTGSTQLDWSADAVGMSVTITGVLEPGYNGTFEVTSVPSASTFTYENPISGLGPSGGGTVTYSDMPTDLQMPNSACSTCHEGTNGDNAAKTEALQEIIDQRQDWTHEMVDEVMATLNAKAVQMGFADAEEAIGDPDVADSDFGKAWTNMEMVAQEGSWGVHNWQYGVAVINKAMEQADAYRVPVAGVTIMSSAPKITFGQAVTLSGTVTPPPGGPALMAGDQVRLWVNGAAANFATLSGNSYTFTGVKPNRNTKFQIQFVGDANYAPTMGDSTTVNVAYKVIAQISKTAVAAGAKVSLQGTVSPTAGPVTIQRNVSGDWKTFKSGVGVGSNGKWTFTFTAKKGTYKLRAVKAATATLVQGISATRTVTAK
ncbi:MAG TPA: hypothetical protein VJ787_12010 [Thermoleophilia bacterium]|nr:hypothetical protein [Thermoleophilia bacterium]